MKTEYLSELHNYAQLTLNEKEVEIIKFLIEYDKDFKAELYERNNTYFFFKENDKTTVQEMVDYIQYAIDNPNVKPLIRMKKIERIKEGS